MKWITPAEARLQIMAFNKMMGRLEKNEYTSKRLKTCDLNKLPGAFPRMMRLLLRVSISRRIVTLLGQASYVPMEWIPEQFCHFAVSSFVGCCSTAIQV